MINTIASLLVCGTVGIFLAFLTLASSVADFLTLVNLLIDVIGQAL